MADSTIVHVGIDGGRVELFRFSNGREAVMAIAIDDFNHSCKDFLALGLCWCGSLRADDRANVEIPRSGWVQIPNMKAWVRKEGT